MSAITIREATEHDYETIRTWFEDPRNNVFFTSELRDIAEYKKMYYLMALRDRKNRYYMIETSTDQQPLGFIALINIDPGDRMGQLWYVTGDTTQRRRGVMSQAVQLLLETARTELGLHSVYGWVVEDNVASIRVLEKNGFQRIGVQRESYYYDGRYKDRILFDTILQPDERVTA